MLTLAPHHDTRAGAVKVVKSQVGVCCLTTKSLMMHLAQPLLQQLTPCFVKINQACNNTFPFDLCVCLLQRRITSRGFNTTMAQFNFQPSFAFVESPLLAHPCLLLPPIPSHGPSFSPLLRSFSTSLHRRQPAPHAPSCPPPHLAPLLLLLLPSPALWPVPLPLPSLQHLPCQPMEGVGAAPA